MSARPADVFRLNPLLARVVPPGVATVLAPPLEMLLSLRRMARVYDRIPQTASPLAFAEAALAMLEVQFVTRGACDDIPVTGPLVVIANHPFGGVEGLHLYAHLAARRPDVRVLGNQLLGRLAEFAPAIFSVDILGGRSAAARNGAVMRRALRWVAGGGALIVFPAGEVASFDPVSRTIVDPPWQPSIARLISIARAPVVPVYIDGGNSPLFHAAGLIHPRLRTALLPREMFNKKRHPITVRVGQPVGASRLLAINGDDARIEHLRLRTYALACDAPAAPERSPDRAAVVPVAAPVAPELLSRDMATLDPARCLAASPDLEVWHAAASEVPWVMQEIGRLREATFRGVGEGTGRERDIDLYDSYYQHLILWNRRTQEVIGGYRIGHADRIGARYGLRGLYTSTLFQYHKQLLPSLGPALELGRSFVRVEYQRSFAPLLLLWKGIAAYLLRHPEYRTLFGPVSISNDYSPAARALMTGCLRANYRDVARARLVRARHPLPKGGGVRLVQREAAELRSLDALESAVLAVEADQKGVPVLLRQYLKLGARVLAFNVDPAFGNSTDVLVAVDLLQTDPKVLAKYMGREAAERFVQSHRRGDRASAAGG